MHRQFTLPRTLAAKRNNDQKSCFVADGHDRLIAAVKADARIAVETKYADEWNVSGMLRRWILRRKMDAEISLLVAERMPDVSPETLF
ncbi:hypothetical protein Rcae01_00312 [Novipirellula caenicola]|uniref:Uncharacterized protein n=1 Tax=Novipirellula caenicola TaxID=1536901 RepID=A0ABP9VL47_9BACT